MVHISAVAQKHELSLSPFLREKTPFLEINAVVKNCQPNGSRIFSCIFAVWSGIFAAEKLVWHLYIRRNSGLPKKVVLVQKLFLGQKAEIKPPLKIIYQYCLYIMIIHGCFTCKYYINYNPNHIPTKSHKKNHIIPYLYRILLHPEMERSPVAESPQAFVAVCAAAMAFDKSTPKAGGIAGGTVCARPGAMPGPGKARPPGRAHGGFLAFL